MIGSYDGSVNELFDCIFLFGFVVKIVGFTSRYCRITSGEYGWIFRVFTIPFEQLQQLLNNFNFNNSEQKLYPHQFIFCLVIGLFEYYRLGTSPHQLHIQNHNFLIRIWGNQKGIEQKIYENIKQFKKMSKALFQLQNNIKNLRQELTDRIHLAFLNHQSYLCVKSPSNLPFKEISSNLPSKSQSSPENDLKADHQISIPESTDQTSTIFEINKRIQATLKNLSQIFQKRSQNHLNYLIIKQIQGEQECVRRDRLAEYEQKIYDQRRLISDKEVFTESLLRPKKQRPQNMTSEQFQEVRAMEKAEEEKAKIQELEEEVKNLVGFRKKIGQISPKKLKGDSNVMLLKQRMENYEKLKVDDLQKTKANSLETVNTSNMNNVCERQQKPFEEQFNSEIPTNSQKEVKVGQSESIKVEISQLQKQSSLSEGCYSIQLQKWMKEFQRKASQQQAKQKYKRITEMVQRIKQKKGQNILKRKQWKELQIENTHMKAHLKKTRQLYLQTRQTHSSIALSQ